MDFDIDIDAIGLLCPLPVLKLRKALAEAAPATVVRLTATDGMAQIDVPHFCNDTGHRLLEVIEIGRETQYFVQRGEE